MARSRTVVELAQQLIQRARGSSPGARWVAGGGLAVVLALLVAVLTIPDKPVAEARERLYREVSACLLTGENGVADPAVAPVWAGMQEASSAKRIQVRYLAVAGPQTETNAVPYVNSFADGDCGMILAVDGPANAAVGKTAPRYRDVAFVIVGKGNSAANVTVVSAGDDVEAEVARLVSDHLR